MEPPAEGPMCDLIWSDPMDEATAEYLEDDALEAWYAIEYTDNPTRGCGWVFGGQAVDDFLMDNNLLTIVRG
jgi:serine/threonine-protein phosphatase 2B catalytic subunit